MANIRTLLTDKVIAKLSVLKTGVYLGRDTELKGFFVVVGKRKKTFTGTATTSIANSVGFSVATVQNV
jgi:hypothetical protein